jgi:hypothetical protein
VSTVSRAFVRVVTALCLICAIACGIHTSPFKDARGQVVPGSVATMADVVIGGSALGILYAARFPDKVAACVGVGQAADMRESERLSYEFARAEARRRNHRGASGNSSCPACPAS